MLIRGPILNPQPDGSVDFIPDGLLAGEQRVNEISPYRNAPDAERSRGIICPAFFDNHIHIPQHPIRGHFMDGIAPNPPEGRLLAGLNRNVFPAEARCADPEYARQVVREFLRETLSRGVVGGAAYMTVHTPGARVALEMLPDTWYVGPVLMNMNCPPYLRTDESSWQRDVEAMARDFGRRVIVTDRFAVAVNSELRRQAVALARRLGLRMQTHLNEQIAEKSFVEKTLYPNARSYTHVYDDDGLLSCQPILAHCVRMSREEYELAKSRGAVIAHCPTSNVLLGSGIMPLDLVTEAGIEYAICTDVGASPTTSLLCEMAQFLTVQSATPSEAFYRTTLSAAKMLGLDHDLGSFAVGKSMTFVEIRCELRGLDQLTPDEVIGQRILELPPLSSDQRAAHAKLNAFGLDAGPELSMLTADVEQTRACLEGKVCRVVVEGREVWRDLP